MIDQHEATLAAGLIEPVHGAHAIFRAIMQAMARPATAIALPTTLAAQPPLPPELAAIALALTDFETPVWLDEKLRATPEAARYIRFHTGARLVDRPDNADFAFVAEPADMPDLEAFAQGTPEYPDRSTTIVLQVSALDGGTPMTFKGPGIRDTVTIAPRPVPGDIAVQMTTNRARFPRGVDIILAAPSAVAALPRSITFVS